MDSLIPGSILGLLYANQDSDRDVTYSEAMKLAELGLIEGVCGRKGNLRYVRWLSGTARESRVHENRIMRDARTAKERSGNINAATHMGAFKESLDPGWCWTLEACKDLMFDGEARLVAAKRRAEHEAKMNEMYRGEDAAQAASAA